VNEARLPNKAVFDVKKKASFKAVVALLMGVPQHQQVHEIWNLGFK
jgi:hypothetical protein